LKKFLKKNLRKKVFLEGGRGILGDNNFVLKKKFDFIGFLIIMSIESRKSCGEYVRRIFYEATNF
jgi:hypothetical protein